MSTPPTINQLYDKFRIDFPKIDILAPWAEGNGLWVAKWLSPEGCNVEFSARMSKGEMFFEEMRELGEAHFPTDLAGNESKKESPPSREARGA